METTDFKNSFGSDNHSGVHPQILKSLLEVNTSHAPSYGTDSITQMTEKKFENLFGEDSKVFFVFNGTAANVLCLKSLIQPWQSVLCADISHLNIDECGAPEANIGTKLVPVTSDSNGKLTVEALQPHIIRRGDQHFSQPGVLSITQPTELGTVYSIEELETLAHFARENHLKLHIDGARLCNAISYLNITFKQLLSSYPADAISFGGTKNGLLGCEAVVLKNSTIAKDFNFIRKQSMQLPSKMRFLSTQFYTYLNDNLYLDIASHSHKMACLLESKLKEFKDIQILHPVESNAVFIQFPKNWTQKLKASRFFYIWDTNLWSARLMTSFDTTTEDIDAFCETVTHLSERKKNEA